MACARSLAESLWAGDDDDAPVAADLPGSKRAEMKGSLAKQGPWSIGDGGPQMWPIDDLEVNKATVGSSAKSPWMPSPGTQRAAVEVLEGCDVVSFP